ncbi:MAG: hypothetical protein EA378_03025 [Phycisphaerales bacterium]|nr:MAG: hypothetical protein EA378_03025 [Phycisphaerales bacterium]
MSEGGPLRWTAGVGLGLHARVGYRAERLGDHDYWRDQTGRLQRATLRKLLRTAARTEFGRAHGFERLLRIRDGRELVRAYREAVPVQDWYGFQRQIERMREGGERDVLWPGLVGDFAQTSGTTAGDKFIPVTKAMFRSNYLASLDIFAHLIRFGESLPEIMSGRALFLGGSSDVETNAHRVRTGDLSGLVTKLIRWPLSEVYSPGPEIALESHWPTKIERMARLCAGQDVRFISGMPSWAIVLMERVLELTGASCAREVWPNLRVFVHGGVKYTPFVPRVSKLWSGDAAEDLPQRLELYPASEGFLAIQDEAWDPGLRLLVDIGNVLEFVPLERIGDANPPAYLADEVERGRPYVVVLSTCAGLWRYVLGDVVEFETVARAGEVGAGFGPGRVRIVGRHKHFINAFGENIIVEHIERAVAQAASETGVTVGEFTAAPVYPNEGGGEGVRTRAGLELAVEIEGGAEGAQLAAFRDAFDEALKAQNVDYTTKRKDGVGMVRPRVSALGVGAFHRWLESRGKLGGQHKCPRCANHREIIEEVKRVSPALAVVEP